MCRQINDRMLYLERNHSLGGWHKVFSPTPLWGEGLVASWRTKGLLFCNGRSSHHVSTHVQK